MKKAISVFLAAALALGLTACGGSATPSTSKAAAPVAATTASAAKAAATTAPSTKAAAASAATTASGTKAAAAKPATKSLVLYTSASTSEYELIVAEFNKKYPDIKVEVVSAGTGELSSKIVAEAANPQGDVLMGGGESTYRGIEKTLEPYKTANVDALVKEFVPSDYLYMPCYLNVNAFIINNSLIKKTGVTVDSWESLLNPALKGQISFADPSASGSALEEVINMLAAKSTDGKIDSGWPYVEKFIANLNKKIAAGSSDVYKGVVAGEYAVGLTNEDKAINYIQQGADVSVAYPKEGITLRTSNIAIIKGGSNNANAKLFIDFVTSKDCQTAMESKIFVRPSRTDVPMTTKGRLATSELKSLPYPKDVNSGNIKTKFQDLVTK